jgi:hypothetical protein
VYITLGCIGCRLLSLANLNMNLPLTQYDLLQSIAVETARMSHPGSMSRGKKPVVSEGTKAALEIYFRDGFPMDSVWNSARMIAANYETWHMSRVNEIAAHIATNVSTHNVAASVASKFLNTFMHQLMKYENARALFACLHLPLDARVFAKLLRIRTPILTPLRDTFSRSPYSLPYEQQLLVQGALWHFITELNARPGAEFQLTSRIELNRLWL